MCSRGAEGERRTPGPMSGAAAALRAGAGPCAAGGARLALAPPLPSSKPAAEKPATTKDTTRAGGMFITEHCSAEDSEYLAQQFKNLTRDVPFWTACSQAAWIDKFHGGPWRVWRVAWLVVVVDVLGVGM